MCWDANVTGKNTGQVPWTEFIIYVDFPTPRGDFPEVDEWYDGNVGEAMPVGGNPSRKWQVKFRVNVPPGESVHVGWDFEESVEFDPPKGGIPNFASLRPRLEQHGSAFALVADSPDAAGHSIVKHVAFAASPERLPLAALIENDDRLAALEWHEPDIRFPAMAVPGEELFRFEISPDLLKGAKSFVWVATLADPEGTEQNTIFSQGPIAPARAARG